MCSYYPIYEKRAPKEVKGGIKAQSKRGAFAKKWWASRWIDALERFADSKRLGRGRNYARRGQVLSIDIKKGVVYSEVQGSRSNPYQVEVKVDLWKRKKWELIIEELSKQAIFAAKLFAGAIPQDIEIVFNQMKLSLLPDSHNDLVTDCTCPDWSNPCKHVAAVLYLIGEEFDRDPFLIFRLRGIDREEFLELLGQHIDAVPTDNDDDKHFVEKPLDTDPALFWRGKPISMNRGEITLPPKDALLPRSLGGFPFWQGEAPFLEELESIYNIASQNAIDVLDT